MAKRICKICGKSMMEGYCIDNGLEYYCSDECLHKVYSAEEWEELYDDGNGDSYWTEWCAEDVSEKWRCNICGELLDIDEDFFDDVEEILWGHIQLEHEDVFEECQNWETPYMIEEYFEVEEDDEDCEPIND